jgi:hypothetical protein
MIRSQILIIINNNRVQRSPPAPQLWPFVTVIILYIIYFYFSAYIRARIGAEFTYCQDNLKKIGIALSMYYNDNENIYPIDLSFISPKYIKSIPTCRAAHKDTYSIGYIVSLRREKYTVSCQGKYHSIMGLPSNFPQFNSENGLRVRP